MTALSASIAAGLGQARIGFGPDCSPLISAARLCEAGTARFTASADVAAFAMILSNDQPTVECLLGAIVAGATVLSLPLPGRGADVDRYVAHLAEACRSQGASEIVAADDLCMLLEPLGLPMRRHTQLSERPLAASGRAGFRLLQFTSGSTDQPKPIILDDLALGANVAAILDRVAPRPGDAVVSWLPLSHDMGLIGMLLASVAGSGLAGGGDIVLLDPATFMRSPGVWLKELSERGASITAAPDFALRLAMRRPPSGDVDLSALRCVIVGGEIVRAGTLDGFVDGLRASRFRPEALCPAYGMAEIGLAATMTPPDSDWRKLSLAIDELADERVQPARPGQRAADLVACGPALRDYRVRCDTASGGEAHTGGISVAGPSVGVDAVTGQSCGGPDGWLRTGDQGFVQDGWLYVCGRVDDYLVAHGRNLYAPAIEAEVGAVDGVRAGRVGAVSLPSGEWVVVAEAHGSVLTSSASVGRVRTAVRRAVVKVTAVQPDEVILTARGSLPLTTSGKLRRRRLRALMLRGELVDAAPAGPTTA